MTLEGLFGLSTTVKYKKVARNVLRPLDGHCESRHDFYAKSEKKSRCHSDLFLSIKAFLLQTGQRSSRLAIKDLKWVERFLIDKRENDDGKAKLGKYYFSRKGFFSCLPVTEKKVHDMKMSGKAKKKRNRVNTKRNEA